MAGPFPGMDPYLESASVWPDFHHELATALRHVLLDRLPSRYFVKVLHRRSPGGSMPMNSASGCPTLPWSLAVHRAATNPVCRPPGPR